MCICENLFIEVANVCTGLNAYPPVTLKMIQSNFNGSNTFGTMKISSRLGEFEPMRVDKSAR